MKNKQNVWIRGVEGRGEEVLNALKALGGKLLRNTQLSGGDDDYIYIIDHESFIAAVYIKGEIAKIIMDCYREIKLSEHWKDGTVLFSPLHRTFAVCTEEEDAQWGDVMVHFILNENEIEYNLAIKKSEYRIANKKELKIFSGWLHNLGYDFDFKIKKVVKWQWRPKEDETYWVVNISGFAKSFTWYDDICDKLRFTFGNCFRTKEDAEAASERIRCALNRGKE